ncbi:MAG: universal stress protein [Thermoplasmata archaeon]|nr:universal stress protein [Thermoplasmata archaeon]
MFRKILYPTDFSKDAEKALEYVKKLKEAGTKEVVIVHIIHEYGIDSVIEGCKWAGLDPEQCKNDVLGDMIKKEQAKAEKILREIEAMGIEGKVRIDIGKPAAKIIEISEEEDVSLIVMGAHGARKTKELLLGSVTEKVIRHAKVPVLVVR